MAKINEGILGSVSGKLGPVVVVKRGDTTYIRTAPTYKPDSWSERQVQHRQRFKAVSAFCRQHQQTLIRPIWNNLEGRSSGYQRFLKANMPAFGPGGILEDLSLLHVADGTLNLPFKLNVRLAEQDPARVEVSWHNGDFPSKQGLDDELLFVTVSGNELKGPFVSSIKRAQAGGILTLQSEALPCEGLFVFFAAPDRKSYSPDRFFPLGQAFVRR
ncbi:hypothetical protein [Gaoshiqia sediminis]|uniref:Uncharacterized protein n=1 Tax=Gaoshiqia sediminis TaxID=2986998 RepID=A0AA41Y0E8_9BACT|nr:hypothetical protein [Gaoshiqia sediminis]MCW0481161.1 hypothetical protein [Gaoshiqia sediminis]